MIDHWRLLAQSPADFEAADAFWRSVSVPMSVVSVPGARVLWINSRWFLQRGIDVSDARRRAEVDGWLLDRFAIATLDGQPPAAESATDARLAGARTVHADRYGGRGIGHSGGSGRCAYVEGFYVKGIGPTPLCDPLGPFFHTHGALPLGEALREVILSEVAGAEMPHGAVPTLAVIAIPPRLHHGEHDAIGEARALLVRPAFVRAGHVERATAFVAATQDPRQRDADNLRVQAWVRAMSASVADARIVRMPADPIQTFARRIAEQMAFGRIHRLFHESYIASNLCVDGALADFGSFRSLVNWEGAHVVRGMPSFGSEWITFTRTVLMSMAFHASHFSAPGSAPVNVMLAIADGERVFERRLQREVLALFGLTDQAAGAAALAASLRRYLAKQNAVARDYCQADAQEDVGAWLWNDLFDDTAPAHAASAEAQAVRQALATASGLSSRADARAHSETTARRTLLPRDGLYRDGLKAWIAAFLSTREPGDVSRADIEAMVVRKVSEGRRLWGTVDDQLTVQGQTMTITSSALWVRHRSSGRDQVLLRCPLVNGQLDVFGHRLAADPDDLPAFAAPGATVATGEVERLCDIRGGSGRDGFIIGIDGREAWVPPMSVTYA